MRYYWYTETLLNTNAFTHQRFYKDVYTNSFTHTFTRNPFTHKHFYTQTLSHTATSTLELRFARQGCCQTIQTRTTPQLLAPEPHFVRKGCCHFKIAIFLLRFLTLDPHFRVAAGPTKLAKNFQLLTLEPRFVPKGCRRSC